MDSRMESLFGSCNMLPPSPHLHLCTANLQGSADCAAGGLSDKDSKPWVREAARAVAPCELV